MSNRAVEKLDAFLTIMGCAERPMHEYNGIFLYDEDVCGKALMSSDAEPEDVSNAWRATINYQAGEYSQDGIFLMDFQSVHWSKLSNLVGVGKEFTTSDFDCFSRGKMAWVDAQGKVVFSQKLTFGHNGTAVRMVEGNLAMDGYPMVKEGRKFYQNSAKLAIAHYLFEPTWWVVNVGIDPNSPTVSVATDATGVKDAWKLRDVPEGRRRRDALLHWVERHWRKDRHDPEMEVMVRKHLRGSREFNCSGMKMTIKEAETDSIAVWNEKQARKEAKTKEMDRRRRQLIRKR